MDYHNGDADRASHWDGHWQLLQRDFRVELAGLRKGVWNYKPHGAGFGRFCADTGLDD